MSDTLRRIYNSIDRAFDGRAITQDLMYTRAGGGAGSPITALQAFQLAQAVVCELDRQYQLTMIVSQHGVNVNGASAHWEFFFNLLRRRAEATCEWVLPWNEALDGYGQAEIDMRVTPFPAVHSPIRAAVQDGKLLHRQMIGMWRRECERRPSLPVQFRDTDIALADFARQGLDIFRAEFSLTTGQSPHGRLSWIAQTRDAAYYSPFA